jgi:hypothetical protein
MSMHQAATSDRQSTTSTTKEGTPMKQLYLLLAIVGAIVPYVFFIRFFGSDDPSMLAFFTQAFASAPAGGLTADLSISSLVFCVWSFLEARRRGMARWWPYVVVNLTIGLSCAFPLFLYVRERSLEKVAG